MANWYSYDGVGDPTNPSSYRQMSIKPTCTSGGVMPCAIYLNETGTPPGVIDANVLQYIQNALGATVSQPTGANKRFVYVKLAT